MPSKMKSFLLVVALPFLVFLGARSVFGLFDSPTVEPPVIEKPTAPADPAPSIAVNVEQEVKRYPTVEAYFRDAYPNATTHRLGLPPIERDVSEKRKREIRKRCGSCVVCGSTNQLEVEHRRGLSWLRRNDRRWCPPWCPHKAA